MKKIKIGLVGAGWVAEQHLAVLQAMPDAEVVGITSRTLSKAEGLAQKFSIPKVYSDLAGLVNEAKPEALMILVSEDQIFDTTMRAIEFGLPLFIEKPAGLTPEENLRLAEYAKKKNIQTMVGFNRRYYSIFHKGIEIIRQHGPLLGVFVEGHERMWRVRDAGKFSKSILDQWIYANSTHMIDLLRFFGGEPKNIKAISHSRFNEALGDQFAAVMELESGAIGQYHAHWHSPGGWRVVLYGEGVTVEFKPLETGVWTDKTFQPQPIEPDEYDKKFKPGFYQQMVAFVKLVRGETMSWPMLDLGGSYETMALAEKISQGSREAQEHYA